MVKYIIKRLLISLLILFGVSLILYVLVRLMPDTAFYEGLDLQATNVEQLVWQRKELYGLNDNSFWGIIKGYFGWLWNFVRGDFGESFQGTGAVSEMIFKDMGVSFIISFVSLILQLLIAIPLGIRCACNQYGKLDYAATVLTMIGISFPSFFFGNIMIKLFAVELGWFPAQGLEDATKMLTGFDKFLDQLHHLVLPLFVLVILSIGSLMRYTRTNTLEVLNADYIRTARAKGLSENKVVYKHVFRNTMIPLVTTLAGILPGLFGGSMITEEVFALPGIGQAAWKAFTKSDIPFIMTYNMFIAVLTVVGILLTDLMYALVDPRVKLGK
ncbi:MAG: ABC transporter permease [Clostridiales bacterium]|nr:ABC transporter permease [Clostridiales bacterium]